MLCEIEVELPAKLQGKWEPVRVGYPDAGEEYVYRDYVVKADGRQLTECLMPLLIVRPAWKWPEWLKAPWIAMDEIGGWWAYEHEPIDHVDDGEWLSGEAAVFLSRALFDFTPPPCTDWRTSKRRNPNHKDAA